MRAEILEQLTRNRSPLLDKNVLYKYGKRTRKGRAIKMRKAIILLTTLILFTSCGLNPTYTEDPPLNKEKTANVGDKIYSFKMYHKGNMTPTPFVSIEYFLKNIDKNKITIKQFIKNDNDPFLSDKIMYFSGNIKRNKIFSIRTKKEATLGYDYLSPLFRIKIIDFNKKNIKYQVVKGQVPYKGKIYTKEQLQRDHDLKPSKDKEIGDAIFKGIVVGVLIGILLAL